MVQYSADEIRAIVEEAARLRGYVCAHAYGADAIARAVELGVRSIEHGNLIDAEAARTIVAHGAFVVPTLVAYDDMPGNEDEIGASTVEYGGLAAFQRLGMEAVERCRKAGVKLGFGTDLFLPLAHYQLNEFRLRGEVETPIDVLRSVTSVNAELVQRQGQLGCIRQGAIADIIAIERNPLESLAALYGAPDAICFVMKDGRIRHNHLDAR
jgi:imidazolonepropionase-like amidohydrolase